VTTAGNISVDYLIAGSGAMGLAFADVIISETNATVALIDKHDRPGGHWNDAYPFVRLHQPSAFYGVSSRRLGNNAKDKSGWNKGLFELASGSEVCAYFDQVMQRKLLPTGRVQYFPMCEYLGECVALNDLPGTPAPGDGYVVIGAGKTGIDACLWLLRHGVAPGRIKWIMPRDSWYLNRKNIQPGTEFLDDTLGGQVRSLEAASKARSVTELFDLLQASGALLRLSPDHRPTMYRCATVTEAELEVLRTIDNVIRKGRVKAITETEIVSQHATR